MRIGLRGTSARLKATLGTRTESLIGSMRFVPIGAPMKIETAQVAHADRSTAPQPLAGPVFVHSSFRTSSTWFWIALRRNQSALAFYEILNEALATLRPEDIAGNRFDTWASRHPQAAPYFEEFRPLLAPTGGVSGFSADFAFNRFVPRMGLSGPISADEQAYITRLIDHALSLHRVPILTCTRSLGRISGLKRAFGGWHIFLHRNLFQQWMSYLAQLRAGNPYFMKTVAETIRRGGHDPFLAGLAVRCLSGANTGAPSCADFDDLEAAFQAFVGLHLYLSMHAVSEADQVIDVNRLADEPFTGIAVQEEISLRTGLNVDLADARQSVESSGLETHAPAGFAQMLDDLLSEAARLLGAYPGSPVHDFGRRLVADLAAEEAAHRRCTDGTRRELQASCSQHASQLTAMRSDLVERDKQLAKLQFELTITSNQLASTKSYLVERDTRIGKLTEELQALQSRPKAIEMSTSWRLTAPVRGGADALRGFVS